MAIAQAKPTRTPPSAKAGKPVWPTWLLGPACQPTAAAARSTTINTPAALSVPPTVITCDCHGLTGPSVIGVARVVGSGAPQPGFRAALFQVVSLKIGFAMHASLGERVTRPNVTAASGGCAC